jgi:hypothetical protein
MSKYRNLKAASNSLVKTETALFKKAKSKTFFAP